MARDTVATLQYQLNKLTNEIIKNLHDTEGTKYLLILEMYKKIKKTNYSHTTDTETRWKLDKIYTRLGGLQIIFTNELHILLNIEKNNLLSHEAKRQKKKEITAVIRRLKNNKTLDTT